MTEPQYLVRWCAPDARIGTRRGEWFQASVDRTRELHARIDAFEPGRRLRLIHLPAEDLPGEDAAVIDDFMLAAERHGTMLRLLGSGFPDSAEWTPHYQRLRLGWQRAVTRLKVLVEKQIGRVGP